VQVSANMSQKSISNVTVGDTIAQQISLIRERSAVYKGAPGFFVATSTLDNIEKSLDSIADGTVETTKTTSEIEELYNQLAVLQQRAETAEKLLKEQIASSEKTSEELVTSRAQYAAVGDAYRVRVAKIESDKKPLQDEIALLKTELKTLRSTKDSDLEKQEQVSAQIKSAQLELEAYNTEKKKLLAEKADMAAKISKHEFDLKNEKAAVERLQAKQLKMSFAAASVLKGKDDIDLKKMEPIPEPSSATAKKILNPRVKSIIEKAAEAKRDSVREQAYNLLELAKSTDLRNYVGYKEYVGALFEAIRESKFHKRNKYIKLMDDLFMSMTDRKSLKLKEIKDLYKDVFDPSKEEIKKVTERVTTGEQSWWESAKFDFWNWRNYKKPSTPRFVKIIKRVVLGVFSPVKGFFTTITSWW